jgi:hypothetical protein
MKPARALWMGLFPLLGWWLGCNLIAGVAPPEHECDNNVKDGDETGVDCGGAHCPACLAEQRCASAAECPGGVCGEGGVCCTSLDMSVVCAGKCGPLQDNCGLPLNCGGCTPPETCEGDGVASVCGCEHPCAVWAKGFVNKNVVINSSGSWPVAVSASAADSVVLSGSFVDTIDFGGPTLTGDGGAGIFVAKLNRDGSHVASLQSNGDGIHNDYAFGLATSSSGEVLLTGTFAGSMGLAGDTLVAGTSDIFLAKLDGSLGHGWSRHFGGGSSQAGYAVAVDGSGNVVVGGTFHGVLNFFDGSPHDSGGGTSSAFLARFDAAGGIRWSKSFGPGDGHGILVAVDAARNVILSGVIFGAVDFGGGPLNSQGFLEGFVAKFDENGMPTWSKRFSGTGDQSVTALAVDTAGDVVVTGGFQNTVDFGAGPVTSQGNDDVFIVKLDATGNYVWGRRFGDSDVQGPAFVAVDAGGDVIVTGTFRGSIDLGGGALVSRGLDDVFLARLGGADGHHVWSKQFGDSHAQFATGLALDGSGHVLMTGVFPGVVANSVDYGFGPITSNATNDGMIFLAKLLY